MNLLNEADNSKFMTRKWNIVNDQSNKNYDEETEIIYNTKVLKSNLCDYNDAYILVKGDINAIGVDSTQVAKLCTTYYVNHKKWSNNNIWCLKLWLGHADVQFVRI